MRVGIRGEADLAVAEQHADFGELYAAGDQERRGRMPEIVKPHARQPGVIEGLTPRLQSLVGRILLKG